MVLSFALCATLAFAQTSNRASRAQVVREATPLQVSKTDLHQADYNGSIFSKTEGDTLLSNNFSNTTGFTTGAMNGTEQIGGATTFAHGQTAYHSTWHRFNDTTASYFASQATNYPAFCGRSFTNGFFGFNSATPATGFMLMTMQDQISAWGGTGDIGAFNAYIAFNSFNASNAPMIDVKFYQYYRKFNADHCYIDYSVNGTTWNSVEINVKNVDVTVNSRRLGWVTTTLPTAVAHQASVTLRLRWAAAADANGGGAYGYFWAVDDFSAVESPANRLTVISDRYYEGFYQLMPKGLQLPMVWAVPFTNTGVNTQTAVTGSILASANLNSGYTAATQFTVSSSMPSGSSDTCLLDPSGWWAGSGFGWVTDDPSANPPTGTAAYLPTSDAGVHYFYGDITTNGLAHVKTTKTFDTIAYTVNEPADHLSYVWGHDNGILTKFSYYVYGMSGASVYSTTPEDVSYDQAGYTMYNRYVTGSTVPQNWRIRGVQLVASTYPGLAEAGVEIGAVLRKDSVIAGAEGSSVYFLNVATGANAHVVAAGELNNAANLEYETFGDYNVINIDFPEQPALQPNTAYRVGYTMNEDGYFSVADGSNNFYYDLNDTSAIYFRNVEGMEGYRHTINRDNDYYSTLIFDPYDNDYHFFAWEGWPMIRLIVGPYEYRPKTAVTFTCGANGSIYNESYSDLCGTTDSVVSNSTHSYIFSPEEGYMVDQIFENGNAVFTSDATTGAEEVVYSFSIGESTTAISATYKLAETGIVDPIAAKVGMKLQPNPATSNVKLTISGVEGMVNFSIIDMSGRIISNSTINAENAQNINVSNLAKGAYFVRITNDKFSKVEKLIVR